MVLGYNNTEYIEVITLVLPSSLPRPVLSGEPSFSLQRPTWKVPT